MKQTEIDAMAATLAVVRADFNAAAASFNLAAVAMNTGIAALSAGGVDALPSIVALKAVSNSANIAGPLIKAAIDQVAALKVPPAPTDLTASTA